MKDVTQIEGISGAGSLTECDRNYFIEWFL